MIENIVISGGGTSGLIAIGILKILSEHGMYNIKNIKRIYGTSAGSIIAVILSLDFDWETIYKYITDRPWEKVIVFDPSDILNIMSKKGFFSSYDLLKEFFIPLFKAKDIDLNITMKEFYDLTKIDIVVITCTVSNLKSIELSHRTYPELSLITAIAMSTAIPIICEPILYNNTYYCDGGLTNNFPLNKCIENLKKINKDELTDVCETILAISGNSEYGKYLFNDINDSDTMFDYMSHLISRISSSLQETTNLDKALEDKIIKIQYDNIHQRITHGNLKKAVYKEERLKLLMEGEKCANNYLNEKND